MVKGNRLQLNRYKLRRIVPLNASLSVLKILTRIRKKEFSMNSTNLTLTGSIVILIKQLCPLQYPETCQTVTVKTLRYRQ